MRAEQHEPFCDDADAVVRHDDHAEEPQPPSIGHENEEGDRNGGHQMPMREEPTLKSVHPASPAPLWRAQMMRSSLPDPQIHAAYAACAVKSRGHAVSMPARPCVVIFVRRAFSSSPAR